MLLRRAGTGTLPPPGFTAPPWSSLATAWDAAPVPQTPTVTLGPEIVVLGHNDSEGDDESTDVDDHEFGWDNEHPKREVEVVQFKIDWRPVNNEQFYQFYEAEGHGKVNFPESWIKVEGQIYVRSIEFIP
jgi:formylglycine-generating enzyme required for sulfatase activity